MDFMKWLGFSLRGVAALLAGGLLAGCQSGPGFQFDPLAQDAQPQQSMGGTATVTGETGHPSVVDQTQAPILHVGDAVTVTFQDLMNPIPPVDAAVKDDGTVTLIYNKSFHAEGKTLRELERDIRDAYVPAYFVNMTP